MKIITSFVYPPIPCRNFDWAAITENYSGEPCDRVGSGRPEAEAIADLKQQLEDLE